jgi:hypothetical protein
MPPAFADDETRRATIDASAGIKAVFEVRARIGRIVSPAPWRGLEAVR